jgi:hypothetical protein
MFKLDRDMEKAIHQAQRRLCPMHEVLAYIGNLAVVSLEVGPPPKGTTWA